MKTFLLSIVLLLGLVNVSEARYWYEPHSQNWFWAPNDYYNYQYQMDYLPYGYKDFNRRNYVYPYTGYQFPYQHPQPRPADRFECPCRKKSGAIEN
jgi:hypothetical protein